MNLEKAKLKRRVLGYGLTIATVLFMLWLQSKTSVWLGGRYLFLYPAIILSAGLFGTGPSVLATISAVFSTLYMYPFDGMIGVQSLIFMSTATVVIWLFWYRKKAERDLSEREDELRRTFDVTSAGIGCVDVETFLYTQSNDAYSKMLGYETSDLIGRNLLEVTHPADIEMTKN